ncbi:MAG: hypothetical protein Q8L52_02560 [bacterium]|nr:hypothetical protein [bacterium]
MLFTNEKSIETLICTQLQRGSVDTTTLIAQIREQRPKTTKQGVYAALRQLRRDEIVVMHAKKASLNVRWLKQMDQFFLIAEQYYVEGDFGRDNFLNLKDGERISYFFSTPTETDQFWGHALLILAESAASNDEPVYLYNPHEWFLLARSESEREYISIITRRRRFLLTAGAKTPLDRAVANEFDGDMSQYHMLDAPLFTKNNYYLNIIGDFFIEVWLDPHIAAHIEEVYREAEKVDEDIKIKLAEIVACKGRSKLTISRNIKRAAKLKKMLGKNFYIPV